jgi:nucleotide-binding universal stress UspA family protein
MNILKNEATKKLNEITARIINEHGIRCQSKVVMGEPVDGIVTECNDTDVDLIVMGTHGVSGLEKILFGSNTASVIEKATRPVLAVPQNTIIALPKKIVFATDYQENDMQTLKELATLSTTLKAELVMLHVSKEPVKSDRDLIEHFSKAVASVANTAQPYYYVMTHDDIEKGVEQFADSVGGDLLALTTRKRSTFEKLFDASLTKKMVYNTRLPLLAFHASTTDEDDDNDDF